MRLLSYIFVLAAHADRTSRAVKFADEVGYVAIDKGANCLQKCGNKPDWGGHCSFCGLSNGSPGFCCHPAGLGHCSPAMTAALDMTKGHQCIVPNTFSTTSILQVRQLEHKSECWAKCGKKRNWSGECGYCGPKGYCCHPDGRGDCPSWISASVNGRRQACMVPSASRNELVFETEPSSACYDRRETQCKTLHEVVGDMTRCKQFFTFSECMTGLAEDSHPHCLTVVDNYCNDITLSSKDTSRSNVPSRPLGSFNPYEKELFKFLVNQFPGSADFVHTKIEESNFGKSNGDFMAMAAKVATEEMMERVDGMNSLNMGLDRPRITFAILNGLEDIWGHGDTRAFSNIEFNLPSKLTVHQFTRSMFDHMLRVNGASISTQVNMQPRYESFVMAAITWSTAQAGLMNGMKELPIDQARMDIVRLANINNDAVSDFWLMADSIKNLFDELRRDESVSDHVLDTLIDIVQDQNSDRILRNAAMFVEVEKIMADELVWGVAASKTAMDRAYASRIKGDRYFAEPSEFTEDAMNSIMQIAAFYSGAQRHVNIKRTADQMTNNFYSSIVASADRTTQVVKNLTGSKKIFKQVVKEFFTKVGRLPGRLSELSDLVQKSRLPTLKAGHAGADFAVFLVSKSIMNFDASTTFNVRKLMQTRQWRVLDAVLNAVAALDADLKVTDEELAAAFNCDSNCDFDAIRWNDVLVSQEEFREMMVSSGVPFASSSVLKFNSNGATRSITTRAAADLYGSVLMDYLSSLGGTVQGEYGELQVTPEVLQCASDAVATLPDLTSNNARDEIYRHVMQQLYLKSDHSAIDVIAAALQADTWNYGGVYVIETMLTAETAMQSAGTFDETAFNAWDLDTGIDWSIDGNTATDLSAGYMTAILGGYNANVGVDTATQEAVLALQPDIEQVASGQTECTQAAILETTHWECPLGHDPNVQGSLALGCTPEVIQEEVCATYGQENFSYLNGMQGLWGYEWFEDNVANYAPTLAGNESSSIMDGVAQAIASMDSLSGGGGAAYAGDNFAANIASWFTDNDADNLAVVNELLNSGEYEGLDWLLTAGESMMSDFGGNSGGNGSASDWSNGAAEQNGYWQLYDMADAASNGGQWNLFGDEFNGGNASYANATAGWWNDWVNSQDDWGPDSEALWDKWGSSTSYNEIRNGTKDIYGPPGPTGAPGTPGTPLLLTAVSWEFPLPEDCLTKTYREDITEYFTEMGKSTDVITDVTAAFDRDEVLSCGAARELVTGWIYNYMIEQDPTGAKWAAVEPCLVAPEYESLIIRIEAQLTVAKEWAADDGPAYEAIDWDWLTFDLTTEDLTQQFLQENLEQMEELQQLFDQDLIDPEELATNLTQLLLADTSLVTTTAATMGMTIGATTTAATATTTAMTTTTTITTTTIDVVGVAVTENPYAPSETAADPYAPASDGTGEVYGDPHVKVKSQGQQAVCFDIIDSDQTILDFLSDPTSGLEVNGQIIADHHRTRLERIFIRSPIGVEVEITPTAVRVGFADHILQTFGFEDNTDYGKDDMHIEVLSRSSSQRKNGVIVSIGHEIRFHVSIKNGKDSMRFEILDSSGLSTTELTGIIGQSILPHDYTVDEEGNIHIEDRVILNTQVEWNEHEFCRHISNRAVPVFLGHKVDEYHVTHKFDIFKPKWQLAQMLADTASPK